jgi:hypothetical protein
MLALLVDVTLDDGETLAYEDWLDVLYARFGTICGRGKTVDGEALLAGLDSRGVIARALDANHEALRRRLVRAGLAYEYSDSETEIVRPSVGLTHA